MSILYSIGQYYLFLLKVFKRPQKHSMFFKQVIKEIDKLGLDSLGIVFIVSAFMGAVITIQTAYNIDLPFVPRYTIGFATRDSIILEFSSTIVSLVLAGKVGSNIASEIGTMRVTEQIDAIEIMGLNSANILVLPKITAAVLINPFLVALSMAIGIGGGWLAGTTVGVVSTTDFLYGIQFNFIPFYVVYSLIKAVVFAFIITSVSSFYGYHTSGGALEVGKSSTKAVVNSSVQILLFNLILTQLLLT